MFALSRGVLLSTTDLFRVDEVESEINVGVCRRLVGCWKLVRNLGLHLFSSYPYPSQRHVVVQDHNIHLLFENGHMPKECHDNKPVKTKGKQRQGGGGTRSFAHRSDRQTREINLLVTTTLTTCAAFASPVGRL